MHVRARRVASLAGLVLTFAYLAGVVRADEAEPGLLEEDEPPLRIDYEPPQLSVTAREVGLGEVLRAIGAKVGFSVVETAPSSRVVTLSILNASLDDVLRQILRSENHTVLYRAGGASGVIDSIVLLGEPNATTPAPAATPSPERPQQAQDHRDAPAETAALPPAPLASPEPAQESPPVPSEQAPGDASEPGAMPLTVADTPRAYGMAVSRGARHLRGSDTASSPSVPGETLR